AVPIRNAVDPIKSFDVPGRSFIARHLLDKKRPDGGKSCRAPTEGDTRGCDGGPQKTTAQRASEASAAALPTARRRSLAEAQCGAFAPRAARPRAVQERRDLWNRCRSR